MNRTQCAIRIMPVPGGSYRPVLVDSVCIPLGTTRDLWGPDRFRTESEALEHGHGMARRGGMSVVGVFRIGDERPARLTQPLTVIEYAEGQSWTRGHIQTDSDRFDRLRRAAKRIMEEIPDFMS